LGFANCFPLKSLCIPSVVAVIDEGCFASCLGLSSVTFEAGSKLDAIGGSTFHRRAFLTSIHIRSAVDVADDGWLR
jgi:hypothetical protein